MPDLSEFLDREAQWKSAILDEWDACEMLAVSEAGECPNSESVLLESITPRAMDETSQRIHESGDRASSQRFNTSKEVKIALREQALGWIEKPHVLELCCGMGHMWAWVYRDLPYHGVDKQFIFSPRICSLAPAEEWVEQNALTDYNVIDIDTFGAPWVIADRVIARHHGTPLAIVVTDGIRIQYKRGGMPDHLALCFGAQRGLRLAAGGTFYREYINMVPSFMLRCAEQTDRTLVKTIRGDNGRAGSDTNYWAFLLDKGTAKIANASETCVVNPKRK